MKKSVTEQELLGFAMEALSPMIGIPPDRIDVHANFDTFRLNSIHAMQLLDELEDFAHIRISPILFWEYPTLASLCHELHTLHFKSVRP